MARPNMRHKVNMKTRINFVFVLVFVAFILQAIRNGAPNSTEFRFRTNGDVAYVYGTTDEFALGKMRTFLSNHPEVDTLVLRQMSGTIDAVTNEKVARLIRKNRLNTHLEKRSRIASGAVDLFLAGVNRTMECGAMIGVHSWSSSAGYSPRDSIWDEHQGRQERFLADMGINPEFYVFTREAAPPEDVHIMSIDEINRFELLSEPSDCAS